MDTRIRPAAGADAETLSILGARTFHETFAKDNEPRNMKLFLAKTFGKEIQAREIADPRRRIFIAWSGKEAAGYAHLLEGEADASVRGPRPVELLRLYVDKRWHGKGVAAALMETCVKAAREAGFRTLWLGVWEKNPRAIAFYRKWGFAESGAHVFELGDDLQRDVVMEKALD